MGRPKKVQQLDKCPAAELDQPVDKINLIEALQLRFVNGLTYQQIADKYGCTKQAVEQRISGFKAKFGDSEDIKLYKDNRNDLLTIAENTLLTRILDPSKLEKATTNNLAYAFQQIFNARRLEEGKSTANLQGIYGLILQIDRDERKAVEPPNEEVIDV